MKTITSNELKRNGVSLIEKALESDTEAVISVRGKNRLVVMDIETFDHLRACEIESALRETSNDLKAGNLVRESVEEHIARVTNQ